MSDDQDTQQDDLDELTDDQETSTTLEAFYDDAAKRIRFVPYQGEPWYSIVDVIALLTDSPRPRKYWSALKTQLTSEGSQLSQHVGQLKMRASDGKQRLTDAANEETILRLIQSIPSPKAEPFKRWMARVAHERLEETRNPMLAVDRMRKQYQKLGYSDKWIETRLRGIVVRDALTGEWRARGAEGKEIALLTDTMSKESLDVTTGEHREIKHIGPRAVLRDSYTRREMLITEIGEEAATDLHQERDSQGFDALQMDVREAGKFAGDVRRQYEAFTGRKVVSSENYKTLRQERQRELQPPLFGEDAPLIDD